MFGTIVVFIALAVAAAPHTDLVCRSWCAPQAAAAGCHHENTSNAASLAGVDNCNHVVLSGPAISQDNGREGSNPRANAGVIVAPYLLRLSNTERRFGRTPHSYGSFGRFRTSALRV